MVATIYNSGAVMSSAENYEKLKNLPSFSSFETAEGPILAAKRAKDVVRQLGGVIERAASAMKPGDWHSKTENFDKRWLASGAKGSDGNVIITATGEIFPPDSKIKAQQAIAQADNIDALLDIIDRSWEQTEANNAEKV